MPLFFTPNPCIERTLRVPDFALNASFRIAPAQTRVTAGGKGLNAARVAANFGAPCVALAPTGLHQTAMLRALIESDGVRAALVERAGHTRTAINIVHQGGDSGLIETGAPLTRAELETISARWSALLPACELAVIGGAYAPGGDANHGAHLCQLAARAGRRVFYDGHGIEWARAVQSEAPPWAIKPNLEEARAFLGRDLAARAAQIDAVRELGARGIEVVLLSCGARGLWVGFENQVEWLSAPRVETVSAVGSGDALVGAFVAKFLQCGDIWQAAKWGVAAGASNAAQLEAARVGPQDATALMADVKSERVNGA